MTLDRPRDLAERLFRVAVQAVDSETLTAGAVEWDGSQLRVADRTYRGDLFDRVLVVGAGKAGAGMARGIEHALTGVPWDVSGQVNVPDDCVRPLDRITLFGARPAGVNEPTEDGVQGTHEILQRVGQTGPRDLCLVLLSGGGSALLTAPTDGVSVADKRLAIRQLAAAGADIKALNTVRRHLSQVKGGGLAAACRAGAIEVLVISDVIGDDLATIASGPTVDCHDPPGAAKAIYEQHVPDRAIWPSAVAEALDRPAPPRDMSDGRPVHHTIIGSNAVAVAAAEHEAQHLGCDVISLGSGHEGDAAQTGRRWAQRLLRQRANRQGESRPLCLIDGGEPTVRLAETDRPRSGGRNQELVLAAIDEMADDHWSRIALLSGGTDGEDGPTDAAGAVADAAVVAEARARGLDTASHLAINDSYPFFSAAGGLIKTGPTHTNVMDIRIGVICPE